jgi:hypothetical protein
MSAFIKELGRFGKLSCKLVKEVSKTDVRVKVTITPSPELKPTWNELTQVITHKEGAVQQSQPVVFGFDTAVLKQQNAELIQQGADGVKYVGVSIDNMAAAAWLTIQAQYAAGKAKINAA